jgi:DNA-binding transcriptional ArsR family regulator
MKTAPVWTALSDSTRRQILDLLRERARTTGELAARFPTSRFAVMKHLTILEEAKLIVVRRSGRERWNYLNAAPLQVIYERWVKPYEAVWTRKLTGLKSKLEGSDMAAATVGNVSQVEMEIEIAASRERVWEALIEETTFWWPRDFYTSQRAKSFHIEPKLGGRLYEDWGEGEGCIWYTVFGIEKERSLDLQGCMAVPHGPAYTLLQLKLEEAGSRTVLKLSDTTFGNPQPCDKAAGWKQLFEDGLKRYVETRPDGATSAH